MKTKAELLIVTIYINIYIYIYINPLTIMDDEDYLSFI